MHGISRAACTVGIGTLLRSAAGTIFAWRAIQIKHSALSHLVACGVVWVMRVMRVEPLLWRMPRITFTDNTDLPPHVTSPSHRRRPQSGVERTDTMCACTPCHSSSAPGITCMRALGCPSACSANAQSMKHVRGPCGLQRYMLHVQCFVAYMS